MPSGCVGEGNAAERVLSVGKVRDLLCPPTAESDCTFCSSECVFVESNRNPLNHLMKLLVLLTVLSVLSVR